MLYAVLLFIRFYPFWAVPAALISFELGVYHYNRRERIRLLFYYGLAFIFSVSSLLWIVFEGYWKAWPILNKFIGV